MPDDNIPEALLGIRFDIDPKKGAITPNPIDVLNDPAGPGKRCTTAAIILNKRSAVRKDDHGNWTLTEDWNGSPAVDTVDGFTTWGQGQVKVICKSRLYFFFSKNDPLEPRPVGIAFKETTGSGVGAKNFPVPEIAFYEQGETPWRRADWTEGGYGAGFSITDEFVNGSNAWSYYIIYQIKGGALGVIDPGIENEVE